MGLQVAACLGNNFSPRALEKAQKADEIEDAFLGEAVELGFLRRVTSDHYVWGHDLIHQSALDLIPSSKRDAFHLLIGSRLFMNTHRDELEKMIFYICDNMNRGVSLIEDSDQRYELAELNLRAGDKAISASAFQSASKLLSTGVSLLGPDCWSDHYELTMRLYNEGAYSPLLCYFFPSILWDALTLTVFTIQQCLMFCTLLVTLLGSQN